MKEAGQERDSRSIKYPGGIYQLGRAQGAWRGGERASGREDLARGQTVKAELGQVQGRGEGG
jgi:hypothetical protein